MTSWGSRSIDEPDQEHSNSDINLSNLVATPSINNTQLSISIPITAASSAHLASWQPHCRHILYLSCFLVDVLGPREYKRPGSLVSHTSSCKLRQILMQFGNKNLTQLDTPKCRNRTE